MARLLIEIKPNTSTYKKQSFFYKSTTAEIFDRVHSKCKNPPAHKKEGATCLSIQVKTMSFMSCDRINAFKKYLKFFDDKGLCRTC